MNASKGAGFILIAAGVLALAYGGFSYTKRTHEGHIGSLELSVKDKEHVNVPAWAGVAAIIVGVGCLLIPAGKV
jgi:TRAP-type C4-dicarboxylate transport system permease small subunit